jgi:hypothetical protein
VTASSRPASARRRFRSRDKGAIEAKGIQNIERLAELDGRLAGFEFDQEADAHASGGG